MCYIFQCKNLKTSHIKLITFECMRKIFHQAKRIRERTVLA